MKMAPPTSRSEILARLRRQVEGGKPIIGAGAGAYSLSSAFFSLPISLH
jgi:transcriptional regulator GlxA family with amidase domain